MWLLILAIIVLLFLFTIFLWSLFRPVFQTPETFKTNLFFEGSLITNNEKESAVRLMYFRRVGDNQIEFDTPINTGKVAQIEKDPYVIVYQSNRLGELSEFGLAKAVKDVGNIRTYRVDVYRVEGSQFDIKTRTTFKLGGQTIQW